MHDRKEGEEEEEMKIRKEEGKECRKENQKTYVLVEGVRKKEVPANDGNEIENREQERNGEKTTKGTQITLEEKRRKPARRGKEQNSKKSVK